MTSPESSAGGVEAIRFAEGGLQLLDQRLLPLEARWLAIPNAAAAAQAIHEMVVRGAPAIGITAAYGLALAALQGEDRKAAAERLAASRPTAVNLHWALARMQGLGAQASPERLLEEARTIHAEDLAQNLRMAAEGVRLIGEGARVLTHCNTGALATGGHGTALGVIRSAWRAGRLQAVYHTETRPWLQGARLTAWELASEGIPATMIADAACAQLMAEGQVDWVIVGADRIAANGDTANKIGTYNLAVLAKHHGIPFIVAAPVSTLDPALPDGSHIVIEERDGSEVRQIQGKVVAPSEVAVYNPAFDVTPGELITAIVTERGVIEAPTTEKVLAHLRQQ